MNSSRWRDGQTIAEYLLIFAIVSAAILGMQVYAKRGIQAVVKSAADQMSLEKDDADGRKAQVLGIRQESGDMQRQEIAAGSTLKKSSEIRTDANQTRTTSEFEGGRHTTVDDDTTKASGTSTSQVVSKVK